MRIVCPDCQAVYEVPASRLGGRTRKLRCARCQLEWVPSEAETPAEQPPPPLRVVTPPAMPPVMPIEAFDPRLPDPLPEVEGRFSRRASPRDIPSDSAVPAILAIGISVLILAGAVACAFVWRGDIMAAWPPIVRLFALIGLA